MAYMIRGIDRRKSFISTAMAILVSIGLSFSLFKQATINNSPTLDFTNEKLVFIRTMFLSMPTNKVRLTLLVVIITMLIYKGLSIQLDVKDRVIYGWIAMLFSGTQIICYALKKTESWTVLYEFPINRVRTMIRVISLAIVFYYFLKVSLNLINQQFTQRVAIERRVKAWHVALIAGLIFLAWFPYFSVFYPGTSNEDTVIMIMEYFHIPSYIQEMSAVQGEDIFITNHHPYLLILLFGRFIKFGLDIGDIQLGVAVYTILHMIFLAVVFAVCILYLRYIGVTIRRCIAVLLLIMFVPVFPMYSICMVKDTIYGAFCLLFVIMMNEIARTKGAVLKKWWFLLLVFTDGSMMMLTKVYGVYIIGIIGVAYLIKYRKAWKEILISMFVPIILFQFVYLNLFLPAMNVAPGGVQEGLSVPLQQTARYLTEYPEDITKEEKEILNQIIPYKYWTKNYEAKLSDRLKKKYNQKATKEDLKAYFKVWWKMFLRHPEVYFEATFANTYEYYDVDKISSLVYYEWNQYMQNHSKKYAEYEYLMVSNDEEMIEGRYIVNQLVLMYEKLPILSAFATIGLIPWLLIFMLLLNPMRGKRDYNIALLLPVITFLICLTSPDNGNYRYIIPSMYAMPFLLVMTLLPGHKYEEISGTGSETN